VIDVLPAMTAGIDGDWPTVRKICRVTRSRQRKMNWKWQAPREEIVYLIITSLTACEASPKTLLKINRAQWGLEIMHRDKDVTLGEDGHPNRLDNAPRNVFSLPCFALKILRSIAHSPTRAIEHFQDDRTLPTRLFSGFH
jgi:predicted transposase YbfD/YdcC